MSEVSLQIDGKEVAATDDMSVFDAAKSVGIAIPTVCHHEKLKPFGGCRLCTVEAEVGGRTTLVAACVYPVQPGLVVRTRSKQIDTIRKVLTEQLLAYAPESEVLQNSGQGISRRQRSFRQRGLILHPVRPVRQVLCRDQAEICGRLRGPRPHTRDQFHSGSRHPRVLGLQGMLPALPDFGITGRLCVDEIAGSHRLLRTSVHDDGEHKFYSRAEPDRRFVCGE